MLIHGWNNDRMKYFLSLWMLHTHPFEPVRNILLLERISITPGPPHPAYLSLESVAAVRAQEGLLWLYPSAGTGKEGKLYL